MNGVTPRPSEHAAATRQIHHLRVALALALTGFLSLSCNDALTPTAPTPSPITAAPTIALPTPAVLPSPTPAPELQPGDGIVVGGELRTRAGPSSQTEQLGTLPDRQSVKIVARVQGENWLVGSQTWVGATPPWAGEWFQLEDGSYVYGAFVFILFEGEASPLTKPAQGQEKWIDVSLSQQVARAMVGDEVLFTAPVTTGAPPFETPSGTFAIEEDGRIAVETMTASQAGYSPQQAQYDVEQVLFTQYFDRWGNALHLNYWRPHSVFGQTPTSHGCVGLELHEAQYLWLFARPNMRVEIHE